MRYTYRHRARTVLGPSALSGIGVDGRTLPADSDKVLDKVGARGPKGRDSLAQANGLGMRSFPECGLKGRDSDGHACVDAHAAPSGLWPEVGVAPARWAGLRNDRAVGAGSTTVRGKRGTRHLIFAVLLLAGIFPAFAAAPVAPADPFTVVTQTNIFDPNRSAVRAPLAPGAPAPVEAPLAVSASLTLAGVVVLRGETSAVFAGSLPTLTGIRRSGETIADLTLATLDLDGATLRKDAASFRLAVGASLVKELDSAWQVTTAPVPAATGTASAAPAAAASSAASSDPEEILRRMRERREKELQP